MPKQSTSEFVQSVENLHEQCDGNLFGGHITTGCDDIKDKRITLHGVLWYPSVTITDAVLFPEETSFDQTSFGESDKLDSIDLKVINLSQTKKRRLTNFHNQSVVVEGRISTACVDASIMVLNAADDEFLIIGGYCHHQTRIYLDDFSVKSRKKTP